MTESRRPLKQFALKSLWDFSLEFYALPEIERVSLELQDKYHANVDIILWCCWLEVEGIVLSASWLDDVLIKIDSVSQLTVSNLRGVRRQLKVGGNFTKVQAKTINKHIMNAELLIEKVLLHRLQDLTGRFLELNSQEMLENPRRLSLEYYLDFLHIPGSERYSRSIIDACHRQFA